MQLADGSFFILAKRLRAQDTATNGPNYAGTGPRHAFQKVSTVDAIVVVIVNDSFRQMPPARNVNSTAFTADDTVCRRFIPEAAELRPNAGCLSGNKAWTPAPDKIDLSRE
jgi:hypothetical protein